MFCASDAIIPIFLVVHFRIVVNSGTWTKIFILDNFLSRDSPAVRMVPFNLFLTYKLALSQRTLQGIFMKCKIIYEKTSCPQSINF